MAKNSQFGYLGHVRIHEKGVFIRKTFIHIIFQCKHQQKIMFSAKTAQKRPKTSFYGYLGHVMIHKKGKFIQKSFKHIIL